MGQFRKKPVVVEAVQWFPPGDEQHSPNPAIDLGTARIHYSGDRKLYYITRGAERPTAWLTVAKTPGEVPDSKKTLGGLGPFPLQITMTTTGEVWWRESYPFNFWSIDGERDEHGRQKNLEGETIDENDDLFLDFAVHMGWGKYPQKATIRTLEGVMEVSPGDWIITGVNGEKYPCKPDIFEKTYEPV